MGMLDGELKRLSNLELDVDQLEKLKRACVMMGISTPESLEELGWYQKRYIMMLIRAVCDEGWM